MWFEQDYFEQYGSHDRGYVSQRENPSFAKRLHELAILGVVGGRLLDIGCAYGFFVAMAEHAGYQCYGVDISLHALSEARKHTQGRLLRLDASRDPLPFPSSSFDVVAYLNTLEHLENYHFSVREALRVLSPGGLVLVFVPLRRRWFTDDTHVNYFTLDSLRFVLERIGFEIVRIGEERGRWSPLFAGLRLLLRADTAFNHVPKGCGSFLACYARKPRC